MTTTTKNHLRAWRQRAGLKQVELAAKSGVSLATLNKAECWGFGVSPSTAKRLANVLNCEVGEIFPYLKGRPGV